MRDHERTLQTMKWAARFIALITVVLILAGCGKPTDPTASTEREMYIEAETVRYGQIELDRTLDVSFTDARHMVPTIEDPNVKAPAAGWVSLQGFKITYWRPWVNDERYGRVDLEWTAAHEVCHFITGSKHDAAHAMCNLGLWQRTHGYTVAPSAVLCHSGQGE